MCKIYSITYFAYKNDAFIYTTFGIGFKTD